MIMYTDRIEPANSARPKSSRVCDRLVITAERGRGRWQFPTPPGLNFNTYVKSQDVPLAAAILLSILTGFILRAEKKTGEVGRVKDMCAVHCKGRYVQ